jgi:phenylpyruvate tautomerase
MPFIKLQTNCTLSEEEKLKTVSALSKSCAQAVGKPEEYVLALVQDRQSLIFAGSPEPAAFLELKSIGLQEPSLKALSAALCGFLESTLSIPSQRVYIEFTNAPGAWWGHNGSTF